jgi:hypothetical protein
MNKRLEDVKLSLRAADELPGTRTTYSVFNRRSSAFIGGREFFDGFLRAKIPSRGDGDHLQEFARGRQAFLGVAAISLAPAGFALEILKICEKGLRENRKVTNPRRKAGTT